MGYLPSTSVVSQLLGSVATALESMVPAIALLKRSESAEVREAADIHRREIELLNAQAKAAQELAIAERIRTAETVTIDEFYDSNGKASLGVKAQDGVGILGLEGSAQRVTRRTITFGGKDTAAADVSPKVASRRGWWSRGGDAA